jgi:hypothetical protein
VNIRATGYPRLVTRTSSDIECVSWPPSLVVLRPVALVLRTMWQTHVP